MATEHESSSSTTTKETPKNCYACPELKFLQVVIVQSSLGQTILKLMNNFLWTVEKCAEWSLPDQETDLDEDENKKTSKKSGLVRPLPWILFLPSLIILRILRMTVNAGALLIGYSQVTPSGLVKFLQTSRKRLNDVKKSGMREKQQDKDERSSMNEARKALIKSIRLTLSSLSCLDMSKPTPSPPPTKIHVSSVLDPDAPTTITSEEKSATESTDATEKQENLTSCGESEEDENNEKEETLKEKIDRLALESSDEDEDFDPADCSSSSIDKSNEEDDDDNVNNVSSAELCDIIKEANVLFNRTTAVQNEIEKFQASERAAAQVYDQRLPDEESRDKVEEHLSQRIDSPTCCTPDRSSQEGDSTFYSPISSDSDKASIVEKTSGKTNNGAIVEKRSTNVSKCHKGKRTSHGNRKKK